LQPRGGRDFAFGARPLANERDETLEGGYELRLNTPTEARDLVAAIDAAA
jgi:hypothetical protein